MVSRLARPALASRFPVHVTQRVLPEIWNLRSQRVFAVIEAALQAHRRHPCSGARVRICAFSIQHNHLHLVAEAVDAQALARGLQGLFIRIARALNHRMRRRGKVFADRYHGHILKSWFEVAHAVRYVRHNALKHQPDLRRLHPAATSPPSPPSPTSLPSRHAPHAPHSARGPGPRRGRAAPFADIYSSWSRRYQPPRAAPVEPARTFLLRAGLHDPEARAPRLPET